MPNRLQKSNNGHPRIFRLFHPTLLLYTIKYMNSVQFELVSVSLGISNKAITATPDRQANA